MIILRKTKLFAKIPYKELGSGNRIKRLARKDIKDLSKRISDNVNKETHKKFEGLRKEMGL